jgi:hypothetical protein
MTERGPPGPQFDQHHERIVAVPAEMGARSEEEMTDDRR